MAAMTLQDHGAHIIPDLWVNAAPVRRILHSKAGQKLKRIIQKMSSDQSLILNDNPEDSAHFVCSIGNQKDFMLAYTPMGNPIQLDLSKMKDGKVNAFWFNPRSGKSLKIGENKVTETPEFTPWSMGRGSDFVLVIVGIPTMYKLPEANNYSRNVRERFR